MLSIPRSGLILRSTAARWWSHRPDKVPLGRATRLGTCSDSRHSPPLPRPRVSGPPPTCGRSPSRAGGSMYGTSQTGALVLCACSDSCLAYGRRCPNPSSAAEARRRAHRPRLPSRCRRRLCCLDVFQMLAAGTSEQRRHRQSPSQFPKKTEFLCSASRARDAGAYI